MTTAAGNFTFAMSDRAFTAYLETLPAAVAEREHAEPSETMGGPR
jgi:hypothetical protein